MSKLTQDVKKFIGSRKTEEAISMMDKFIKSKSGSQESKTFPTVDAFKGDIIYIEDEPVDVVTSAQSPSFSKKNEAETPDSDIEMIDISQNSPEK